MVRTGPASPHDLHTSTEFRLLTDLELLSLKPLSWLVDGVIPTGSLCEMHGAPKHGKTFAALDLALSVATGSAWAGRDVQRGLVVYVAAEATGGFGMRVQSWKTHRSLDASVDARFLTRPVQLLEEAQIRSFTEELCQLEEPPVLVVVDTLARCFSGDENSAKEMMRAVAYLDSIRQATGAAILIVHHSGKKGLSERGSSALRAAVDAMISVEQHGEVVKLTCEAMRDGPAFDPLYFQRIAVDASCVLRHLAKGVNIVQEGSNQRPPQGQVDLLVAVAEAPAGAGLRISDWIKRSGAKKSTASRHAKELIEAGLVQKSGAAYSITQEGLDAISEITASRN